MRRRHAMPHPLARKSCSVSPSTVLVPVLAVQTASNYSAWIAAYRGEGAWLFRPCEKTVAHGSVRACFALANVAQQALQGT